MPLSIQDLVENIVEAILFELKRWAALRESWEKIGHISQSMILDDWRTLIRREIDPHLEKPPSTSINEQGDALGDLRKKIRDIEGEIKVLNANDICGLYNWLREIEKRIAALEERGLSDA